MAEAPNFTDPIAKELNLRPAQVQAVLEMLDGDATIPFIARYRKEATGGLDETVIADIRDRNAALVKLHERREAILSSLTERELLTPELQQAINAADTMAVLEDIYLPYKPKRRTRAMQARERGLEPLATLLLAQSRDTNPLAEAAAFVDTEKGVPDNEAALAGARDIIAEMMAEDAATRGELRDLFWNRGTMSSVVDAGKETEGAKFRDYFNWSEPIAKAPSHRVLALFRGEEEKVLKLSLRPSEEEAMKRIRRRWLKGDGPASQQVDEALVDGYARLAAPSLENETRAEAKRLADEEAIRVFAQNLGELLLSPPLGRKITLGLDPGFRTGCKTVVLDSQGKLLFDTVIFPTTGQQKKEEAATTVRALCEKYFIEAIAIGNGTASRETEAFVRELNLPPTVAVVVVNESGASVYSASDIAREEFPDKDVTVRGAVSIARRLMDPLAELVKIDPKAIGVGQYQHDVDQKLLKGALDDMVVHCVNAVGVEVNTASAPLLSYVSGLNNTLAKNIVKHRDDNGPFSSRTDLKKVARLGPKAFEQCAGFLRISGGKNPLDASAVHPERYKLVAQMASDLGCGVADLMRDSGLRSRIKAGDYVGGDVGLPTITDILAELAKPGRDPRAGFEVFSFADGVHELKDVQPGMELPGIVTNVTNFGAFIDVGVHQDGLAHVSQLADVFVKNPADVVKVGQRVKARVLEVDLERRRISLSLKSRR
ncbi:MAG: RNA-binding transcriptional accessory protein [Planctomycetaceae bacterium]|nr:RNA-binding transcriptional accessory protein [Planctomycetaceae bacterium]